MIDLTAIERSAFYPDIYEPQNIHNQLFMPHASLRERGGIGGVALFLSADRTNIPSYAKCIKELKLALLARSFRTL